ncbi:hypothetical protein V8F20_008498, partial [Naviculisporaceae sp. PSN 640]
FVFSEVLQRSVASGSNPLGGINPFLFCPFVLLVSYISLVELNAHNRKHRTKLELDGIGWNLATILSSSLGLFLILFGLSDLGSSHRHHYGHHSIVWSNCPVLTKPTDEPPHEQKEGRGSMWRGSKKARNQQTGIQLPVSQEEVLYRIKQTTVPCTYL